MPKKSVLIEKLTRKPVPRNFTMHELDMLMAMCGCEKFNGGRGSGVGYVHLKSGKILQFDSPHPGKELYIYQVKKSVEFLRLIGEIEEV